MADMVDKEWLRNLAQATWDGHAWRPGDPEAVRRLAVRRTGDALPRLYELAEDMTAAYNAHARDLRLSLLTLGGDPGTPAARGFILVLGPCQVTLTADGGGLAAVLARLVDFTRRETPLPRLTPLTDAFGSVVWQRQGDPLLMTEELIMKWLFEQLARGAATVPGQSLKPETP